VTRKYLTQNYIYVLNVTLDVCGFLNGTDSNIATKFFFNAFASSLPAGFVRPCPIIGELKAYNLTLNAISQAIQFMAGSYRVITRFYDEKDDNIITTNHFLDVKQSHFKNKDVTNAVNASLNRAEN
jgi:hypothetical protein